ncbi:hypothetical protein Leryth_018910 [Lithospermum erythrorhizon]|nr:hypothetical protein Leryth_018910 [Lithospermum erythrorhizon]
MNAHNPAAIPDEGDDDSWEVKAFEEDTSNVLGATWPPRSYTCSFCMREFRSAQALGGHMNVHRRDRARLHHQPPPSLGGSNNNPLPSSPPRNLIIPTHQDLISKGGVCFLYSLPNNNHHGLAPTSLVNNYSYNSNNHPPFCASELSPNCPPSEMNYSASCTNDNHHRQENNVVKNDSAEGEIDLELRLGYKSSASSSSSSYTP